MWVSSSHSPAHAYTPVWICLYLLFLLTLTRNSSRSVVSSLQLSVYNRQVKVPSLNFFFSLDWTYAWQRGRVTGSCLFMPLNVWRATRKCPHALLLLLSQTLIFDTHHGGSTRLRDKINPFCRPQARLVLGSGSGWSAGTFLTLFDGVCSPCGVLASSSGGSSPETWVPTSGCLPGIQVHQIREDTNMSVYPGTCSSGQRFIHPGPLEGWRRVSCRGSARTTVSARDHETTK